MAESAFIFCIYSKKNRTKATSHGYFALFLLSIFLELVQNSLVLEHLQNSLDTYLRCLFKC